jgi:uncharacterized protein
MAAVLRGDLGPIFNAAVLTEYDTVLHRPRLHLDAVKAASSLETIRTIGSMVPGALAPPPSDLLDPADWPFIACALATGCPVITGNARDFPARLEVWVMTAREWVDALGNR